MIEKNYVFINFIFSGIDDTEMLGLNYIEKQHGVPFTPEDDLIAQQVINIHCRMIKYAIV